MAKAKQNKSLNVSRNHILVNSSVYQQKTKLESTDNTDPVIQAMTQKIQQKV